MIWKTAKYETENNDEGISSLNNDGTLIQKQAIANTFPQLLLKNSRRNNGNKQNW
jgi:hypothetical protein